MNERKNKRSCAHSSVFNEVFDFSASAKDCAPVSLISLQPRLKKQTGGDGDEGKKERRGAALTLVFSIKCLISVHQPTIVHRRYQYDYQPD